MNKVKFNLIVLVSIFFLITIGDIKDVKAYENNGVLVDIEVKGGENNMFKAGENVAIKIKFEDVSNLYAASFLYTYDNSSLQIDSIDVNEEIESFGVYEAYKDIAKDGNKARYCFTCLGDVSGFSGDYDFVTINGKALKDGEIKVGYDNISFQVIKKEDNNIIKSDYDFKDSKGDIYKVTNVVDEPKNSVDKTNTSNTGNSEVKVELIEKAEDVKINEEIKKVDKNTSRDEEEQKNEDYDYSNSYVSSNLENKPLKHTNKIALLAEGILGGALIILISIVVYKRKK